MSEWFATPVPRTQPARDELAIKLAIAVTLPGTDVGTIIQRQRSATMASLQDYTRLKRSGRAAQPVEPADLAWSLVLDSLVFDAEAVTHVDATGLAALADLRETLRQSGVTLVLAWAKTPLVDRLREGGFADGRTASYPTVRAAVEAVRPA